MGLNNFRTEHLIWDRVNSHITYSLETNSGDSNGRKLRVQVLDGGVVTALTGVTLSLAWKTANGRYSGLDAFKVADAALGIFEIYYTTEMLSNVGKLKASLVLVDATGRMESDTFPIVVKPTMVDDNAVQGENSFTALTEALISVTDLEKNYAPKLNEVTAQLAQTLKKNDTGILNLNAFDEPSRNVLQGQTPGTINAVLGTGNVKEVNLDSALLESVKTSVKMSPNLFNKDTVVSGSLITTSGAIGTSTTGVTSEFIPIEVGASYVMSGFSGTDLSRAVATYDANKNFVAYSYNKAQPLTFGATARFVRISISKTDTNTFQFEKGIVASPYAVHFPKDAYKNVVLRNEKNIAKGYLGLDDSGKIPSSYLSSYSKLNSAGKIPSTQLKKYLNTLSNVPVDDTDATIIYTGTWQADTGKTGYHQLTRHGSKVIGNSLEYSFLGTGIEVYDATSNNRGKIEVFIDNVSQGIIDRYRAAELNQQLAFDIDNLPYANHTIKIVILYDVNPSNVTANTADVQRWFMFDRFNVLRSEELTFSGLTKSPATVTEMNKNTVLSFWAGTQAEYDAISVKDQNTLYFIGV